MPKAKERRQDDKIKNHGKRRDGKPVQQQARRVMTAKLKKELAQQKRTASGSAGEAARDDTSASATAEAVEQVEQTTEAAVREVDQQTKQYVSKTVATAKKRRQKIKDRQEVSEEPPEPPKVPEPMDVPKQPEAPIQNPERPTVSPRPDRQSAPGPEPSSSKGPAAPKTRPAEAFRDIVIPKERPLDSPPGSAISKTKAPEAPIAPKAPRTKPASVSTVPAAFKGRPADVSSAMRPADTSANPTVPKGRTTAPPAPLTPGDRMRRLAVDKQKERTRQPKPALPKDGEQLTSAHYGRTPPASGTPVTSEKLPSFENQSIHQSIKERPRQTAVLKEKRQGWTMAPRTRQGMEYAAKSTTVPAKAPGPAKKETILQRITERAHCKARTETQRSMAQSSKRTAKAAADFSKKTAAATTKAVRELISALSALVGGGTLVAALCVIFLIAAVIASPFGLLFSNEPSPGAVPLNAAVTQINVELTDKLALLQTRDYDNIDIQGTGPDWREVAAVFAVKTATGAGGVDVAALTPDRVDRLKAVFWDMCGIATSVETIDHPASGTAEAWTETILHITITAKTADDMRTEYHFTPEQNRALTELLAKLNGIGTLLGGLGISQEDAAELLRRLPDDLAPERRAVIETACKLVGKVNYFWGGKSLVLGWDSRWGTIQKVWAAGSPSTGTYRPYGMDCSDFVDWVFYNMSDGSYVIGHGGGARMQHSYCTPISWAQVQPGDLVFYPEDTHVGIVGGWDESGNIQIIHCASGQNNVVVTGKAGFTTIGRPNYYG